jgi:hypothetical protein
MRKRLVILGLYGAILFGWPCVAENQQGKAHAEQSQSAQVQQPTLPARAIITPSTPTPHGNADADNGKKASEEKPLPRFLRPEWIIVYITAIYVFITGRMLGAIKRQAKILEVRGIVCYEDVFGDRHYTKFGYDMVIPKLVGKWEGTVAKIHPFSRWYQPKDDPHGNEAT